MMKTKIKAYTTPPEMLTSVYLVLMLGLYMLYPGGSYETITEYKWQLYMLLTGGYVTGMFLLRLELVLVGEKKKSPPTPLSLPQLAALVYLGCTALSSLLSPHRMTAILGGGRREGFVTIALYCLSFLLVSRHARPKKWMLWMVAGALSINALIAILQLLGGNPLGLYPEGMNYYDGNVLYSGQFLGTLGNVDILSALLSLSIPVLFAAVVCLKDWRTRLSLLLPLALCVGIWLGSFVAGGILGVCGAIFLSLPVLAETRVNRCRLLMMVAVLLAAAALVVFFFGDSMGGFLYEAHELMHGRWEDSFGSSRIYIWRTTFPLAKERLLLGGGADTLGLRTDAAFERYDENLGILIRSTIDAAHNEYLNILLNQGLLALLAYGVLLASMALEWIRKGSTDRETAICGCGVLGYCIQAFFGISSPIAAPYLWLAMALLHGGQPTKSDSGRKKS